MRIVLLIIGLCLVVPAEEPVTEISFQRSPCRGSCPVDKVVFRSDGTAKYTGTAHVKRIGEHRGRVGVDDFRELSKLLVDKQFFEMKDGYDSRIWDVSWLTTTARRGEKTKKVIDYGANRAPKALEEIDRKILELAEKVEWKKAE